MSRNPRPFCAPPKAGERPTVLFLVNKDTTILQFRLSLVTALVEAGYRVVVALPSGERVGEIADAGAEILLTPMKKDRISLFDDCRLFGRYRAILRELSPHVVLTYTVKPTLWGGMAAAGRVPLVATITGRGRALGGTRALRVLCTLFYRHALRRASAVCFQNEADRAYFARHRIASGRHITLPGSGVDTEHFSPLPYPSLAQGTAFAFISRLLPAKGMDIYIETARRIRRTHPETVFHVAGFGDAETEARMRELSRQGLIVYHGHLRDIRPLLSEVHAVIHPTAYPEGLSNILLEASASGRPVITTDRAGCREAVEEGRTGYLVPERDVEATVAAVERFLSLSLDERACMGRAARRRMETAFDRRFVTAQYVRLVRLHAVATPPLASPSVAHPTNTVL